MFRAICDDHINQVRENIVVDVEVFWVFKWILIPFEKRIPCSVSERYVDDKARPEKSNE